MANKESKNKKESKGKKEYLLDYEEDEQESKWNDEDEEESLL